MKTQHALARELDRLDQNHETSKTVERALKLPSDPRKATGGSR